METLFTVDYALKYEGWTLDSCKAPYGWYLVNGVSINVRRNDFYLRLIVYNTDNVLVCNEVIPSIRDYKTRIKKNIPKWSKFRKAERLLQQQGCSILLENNDYLNW